MQVLARGVCGDSSNASSSPPQWIARLPWPLTPFALVPLLLAYYNTPAALQLLTQFPLLFAMAVFLALLHLILALAHSSSSNSEGNSTARIRTRRQSLKAATDASASLRAALVRLLLDVIALTVLAQGVASLLLLRGYEIQ